MSPNPQHLQQQWKKSSTEEKAPLILAIVTFVATFLPWMSTPKVDIGGMAMSVGISMNGLHSVGMLTFLGSLAYVLWKGLPMVGVKIPAITMDPKMITKILGVAMLAGPVLWILQGRFMFQMMGYGLWIALIASAIFVYQGFTGK